MTEPESDLHDSGPVAPADADEWAESDAAAEPFTRPIDRFARSATGSVVAAGLLGLRDALEGRPEREHPAITAEGPAAPAPDGIDVILDPDHPERSVVILRKSEADREG